jgi:hypothetical protein
LAGGIAGGCLVLGGSALVFWKLKKRASFKIASPSAATTTAQQKSVYI